MSRKRVLYIEDDYHNFLLVERALEVMSGVEVVHASTGVEGLERARAEPPDLILMDVHLPEMDGLTLTRALKAEDRLAHVPVLALTANVMKGERERALEAGCAEFVPKPFSLRSFRQLVAKHLGTHEPG